jgi:hypothetical protein
MDVPITQFRRNLFALVDQALEGSDVWITHKGQRLKIVPEGGGSDKLSRITPMEIIPSGVDLEDDSWKQEMMREWERSWDRQLGAALGQARKVRPTRRTSKRTARSKS